jgi:hypothetical protein
MKSRSKVTSAAVTRLLESQGLRQLAEGGRQGEQEQAGAGMDATFPLPSWDIANSWDGVGIPYGIHSRGLGTLDLAKTPHIATFGETGSGKSRRFLRPFIAFCLAAGHRVVILGKQVDFLPFRNHPNAFILPIRELTVEREASKYALFLRAMVEEMNTRDAYLSSANRSTWGQAGRETTVVVLDEYSNAMDLMPKAQADESRRYAKGLLREGRKYGFSMVLAAQRAVGLRDEATNLGRAVFHVADQQESRYAIGMPGAEALGEGYFMAKFGALNVAGAFEPTDEELAAFLAARQSPPLEPVKWLDLEALDVAPTAGRLGGGGDQKSVDSDQLSVNSGRDEVAELAEGIRERWSPEMSKSAVSRLLGKEFAGSSWTAKVNRVIEYLSTTTPTTTENSPKMGDFEAVGA